MKRETYIDEGWKNMTEKERLFLYTNVVPSERQAEYQRAGFHVMISFGLDSIGKEKKGVHRRNYFNPTGLDTDEWARIAVATGANGVILTVKDKNGFCLWPSEYSDNTIRNTPYLYGNGDIVAAMAASCKKHNLKFGVYLSLWDKEHRDFGSDEFNSVYIGQMSEILNNYGEIFCFHIDTDYPVGKEGQPLMIYDFDRIFATARDLAPNMVLTGAAPDVRWIGKVREAEFNVVPAFDYPVQNIDLRDEGLTFGAKFEKRGTDIKLEDLGSRGFLSKYFEFEWYPAEHYVTLRPSAYYKKGDDKRIRPASELMADFFETVGANACLVVNISPNEFGAIGSNDQASLFEFGAKKEAVFHNRAEIKKVVAPKAEKDHEIEACFKDDKGSYAPKDVKLPIRIILKFNEEKLIDRMQLRESIRFSQRIEEFEIYARVGGMLKTVYKGKAIGARKIALFDEPVLTSQIVIVILKCRQAPYLEYIAAYEPSANLEGAGKRKKCWFKDLKAKLSKKEKRFF
jgi:alpha-L-fucosidase